MIPRYLSSIIPVSYTHLDVYKRQMIINMDGQPTYFMTLKDNAGLIKQYAFEMCIRDSGRPAVVPGTGSQHLQGFLPGAPLLCQDTVIINAFNLSLIHI